MGNLGSTTKAEEEGPCPPGLHAAAFLSAQPLPSLVTHMREAQLGNACCLRLRPCASPASDWDRHRHGEQESTIAGPHDVVLHERSCTGRTYMPGEASCCTRRQGHSSPQHAAGPLLRAGSSLAPGDAAAVLSAMVDISDGAILPLGEHMWCLETFSVTRGCGHC